MYDNAVLLAVMTDLFDETRKKTVIEIETQRKGNHDDRLGFREECVACVHHNILWSNFNKFQL